MICLHVGSLGNTSELGTSNLLCEQTGGPGPVSTLAKMRTVTFGLIGVSLRICRMTDKLSTLRMSFQLDPSLRLPPKAKTGARISSRG